MSNDRIKSAIRQAQQEMRRSLSTLNESAADNRESLRYHQGKVRYYKENLDRINKHKGQVRRELKKSDEVLYNISPVKNLHKGEQ